MLKNGINPNFLITQTKTKPFKRLGEIAISMFNFLCERPMCKQERYVRI